MGRNVEPQPMHRPRRRALPATVRQRSSAAPSGVARLAIQAPTMSTT